MKLAEATPLLKWAGGKRRQLKILVPLIVERLEHGGRYLEPFLGGGAVALHLGIGERMILNDAIAELVVFYRTVRDEPARVAWALSAYACRGVDEAAYYSVRDERPTDPIFVAARMLYLNRLGFNGLYRVNVKGEFNVPYGKQPYRESVVNRKSADAVTSLFPHKGKIEAVSDALRGARLLHGDFERVIDAAGADDVVYADPPYDGTYNSYNAQGFTESDQRRLAKVLKRARYRGARVLTSNSDTPLVRELYSWAELLDTKEGRPINADVANRGKAPCVLAVAG